MRIATVAAAVGVLAWFGRRRLVAALTRTTGTWVGTPPSLRSPATQAGVDRSSAGASSLAFAPDHG